MRPSRLPLALALLGSVGCAQLFGLDETAEMPEPPGVNFSIKRYVVGPQVTTEPLDLTGATGTYLIPDPTDASGFRQVPVVAGAASNQWRADIPEGTNAFLRYTLAGETHSNLLTFSSRSISSLAGSLAKPNGEPVPDGAAINLGVTLNTPFAAGERFQWLTIGSWTQRNFTLPGEVPVIGATVLAPPAIPFLSASALAAGVAHQRLTTSDVMLVLRHNANNQLTGVFEAPPFDLIGGPNTVVGAMLPVALDQTLAATLDTTGPVTRIAAARPAFGVPGFNWQVTAAPGAVGGFANGPALATGALLANTGQVPLNVAYGNPFPARPWPPNLVWSATATRSFTPPGGLPLSLTAQLFTFVSPPADALPVELLACLPTSVAVQGATLLTDGLTVTIDRTKPVSVSFVADTSDADRYQISLYEVVSDPAPATTARPVLRFTSVGDKPMWSLPGDVFEGGKVYMLRAVCGLGGFPNIASGDLETRDLPIHVGFIDAGVFTVAP